MIKKNALVQKFKEWLNKQLPTLKEQEVLFKNVFSLVEKKETDKFVKKALHVVWGKDHEK
ncbi:MAG: hypothetical protein GX092_04655 [Clostridia bacterium]|jgi:alanine dehydrogenase|nr:hypothetical protein [Clostridia bacterium]